MVKILAFIILILMSVRLHSQINLNDSTAQVIGYWDKDEKQSYVVTQEKYKIKGSDTTSREVYKYVVDISVVDSTADSYVIDWFYRDHEFHSENELLNKLSSIMEDVTVRVKTNELGVFQEVLNWEDVRECIFKGTRLLAQETKNIPNMDLLIRQLENTYSTKASIELGAISEMQQFYTFHGAKYEFGQEYNADMKVANLYGGEPFDTKVTVWLDEINSEDNNFILRMIQVVDPEQLTAAVFDYLTKMAETLKIDVPKREDIPQVSNETYTASRIHGSGWIIYSVETKETKADGETGVEERIIEIL